MSEDDDAKPSIEVLNAAQDQQASPITFDHYKSLADPTLMIFVAKDAVPPASDLRRAGVWELLKSSIDLGPTMKTRITEKGFLLCRLNNDRSGLDRTDRSHGLKAKGK